MLDFIKTNTSLYAYLIMVAAVVISIGWCFFGIDYQDSFYYLNLANAVPLSESPFMVVLSTIITHFLIEITDGRLLDLRIINICIYIFAFCLPPFFLEKQLRNYYIAFSAILLMVFSPFITNIIGPDTFSAISIVTIGILCIQYLENRSKTFYYSLIIILACAVLCRFPNILLLPLIAIIIGFADFKKEKNKLVWGLKIIGLVALPVFLILVTYYLVYGNSLQFMESNALHENNSYSLKVLMGGYIFNFISVVKMAVLLFFVYLLVKYSNRILENRITLKIARLAILILLVVFIYNYSLFKPSYHRIYALFFIAMVLLTTISIIVDQGFKKNQIMPAISLLLIMFVAPAGSNTGLYKFVYVLPLFLIIFSYASSFLKKAVLCFLVLLIPVSLIGRINGVFQDDKLFELNKTVHHPKLRGIFTTDIRKKNIEIILQTIKNNNDSNYVFGNSSHIFNYLLHKPLKYDTFLQELTENKIHTFMESNSKSCIYIDGYPNNKIEEGKYLLQDSLEEKNYKVFIFDNYVTIEKIF